MTHDETVVVIIDCVESREFKRVGFWNKVEKGESKGKAQAIGKERYLVFEGSPALDAKSRRGYELPERILFNWDDYDRELKADAVLRVGQRPRGLSARRRQAARRHQDQHAPQYAAPRTSICAPHPAPPLAPLAGLMHISFQ